MTHKRRKYSPEFKLKAVTKILKGEKIASQLAGELGVYPIVLSEWKKHFLETGAQIFEKPRRVSKVNQEEKEKPNYSSRLGD